MPIHQWPETSDLPPPGVLGAAIVEEFEVSQEDAKFANLCNDLRGSPREARVRPGVYRKLIVGGVLMMSNTDFEMRTNSQVVANAHGDVLIAGLGLGMILHPICRKPEVRSVTVLESNADVVALVATHFPAYVVRKTTVVTADAFAWRPVVGTKFQTIYFDIWPQVCTDNLPAMAKLSRRFAPYLDRQDSARWRSSWMQEYLQREARREARQASLWL